MKKIRFINYKYAFIPEEYGRESYGCNTNRNSMGFRSTLKTRFQPIFNFSLLLSLFVLLFSCSHEQKSSDWKNTAVIYEVNLQYYTPEGTFNAFRAQLPRLQDMGIKIIWLMPIFPRGEKMKIGKFGSPYAVRNYYGIHEPFGTKEDLKALVNEVHAKNMKLLLDWVPNHTSWDNNLITEHPEYYSRDSLGNIRQAYVWRDIAQLDYSKMEVQEYMINAMKYWIKEFDIDGYRCDVAWGISCDFWKEAIAELRSIKPVFMLAEAEGPQYHRAGFDMTYTWQFMNLRDQMTKKKKNILDLDTLLEGNFKKYEKQDIRMYFTSNHDEEGGGTSFERLKGGNQAWAVLTFTLPGMPMVYCGQETGNNLKASYNEKVAIQFQNHDLSDFYKYMISLKAGHPAIWNGTAGGDYTRLSNGADTSVISFIRSSGGDEVLTIINLSDSLQSVCLNSGKLDKKFRDLFKENYSVEDMNGKHFLLMPYEFRIFSSD
jgi:cyclomaltodextrinase